jgi:L-methionine (R)-S-oxide reductase
MHQAAAVSFRETEKPELYRELGLQLAGLFTGERNMIANAANMSALLYDMLPDLNWAGFYFLEDKPDGELVVGPFQGKPACVRIAVGRGVCGTAVERGESIVVEDVHEFPGHIACDAASQSEVVVPVRVNGRIVGVLDLDSPHVRRFDEDDRAGLEAAVAIFAAGSDF